MDIVILNHQTRTVYTNLPKKMHKGELKHQMYLRNPEASHYTIMPLKAGMTTEIPMTTAIVARENGMMWVDICGDLNSYAVEFYGPEVSINIHPHE